MANTVINDFNKGVAELADIRMQITDRMIKGTISSANTSKIENHTTRVVKIIEENEEDSPKI